MTDFIIKYKTWFLFGLLLAIVYFPLFLHLDFMPLRVWDESIMGVNAIEMSHNHHYLVTYFFGGPDMSNCKPPLMIWCILVFTKVFGFSELSLRLPSAIAALILCIYLFVAIRTYIGSAVYGFITVLVLVTCQGYIRNHVTRTGEYDSLLVLFSTLFSMNFFFATETAEKKARSKYLFLFFVFLTLAVLTKGVTCMMLLPGLVIYVVIRKRALALLKDKAFYAGLLFFMLFGTGYYFLREFQNPGYLKAVWLNELGGRYGAVNQGHVGAFTFYLDELFTWQFTEYLLLFPIAVIVGLRFSDSKISRIVLFAIITGALFLTVISTAQTKLPHYDAPVFPFLAIVIASFFYFLYCSVRDLLTARTSLFASSLIAFTCVALLPGKPYKDIISHVYFPHGDFWEESFSVSCKYFQLAVRGKIPDEPYKLVFDRITGYGQPTVLKCYKEELLEHRLKAQIVTPDEVRVKDTAVIFDNGIRHKLEQRFEIENLRHIDECDADIVCLKNEKRL